QSKKLFTADQVRDRAPPEAAADQLTEAITEAASDEFAVAQAVQVDALAAQDVGEQQFGLEAGRLDPLLGQEARGLAEQDADGQVLVGRRARIASRCQVWFPFRSDNRTNSGRLLSAEDLPAFYPESGLGSQS